MAYLVGERSQTAASRFAIVLGTILVLFMVGCGDSSNDAKTGLGVDKAFLEVLLPREQSALEMSQVATRRARSKAVRKLAARAASERQARITRIIDYASRFPGASTQAIPLEATGKPFATVKSLSRGRDFDAVYLGTMITNDQDLLEAIAEVQASGSDPGVETVAKETRTEVAAELAILRSVQRDLTP